MAEYYFLASLLPELQIGHSPHLRFKELKPILQENMSANDLKIVKDFLRMIDLDNLRALWIGEDIDPRGNFSREELSNALINMEWSPTEEFPFYMRAFLEKYQKDNERAAHFFLLMSQFLDDQIECQEGFLQRYLTFEKEWRLVMVGFRAKHLGKDVAKELEYEDAIDPIVAQILAQKDAKGYEPPFEYKELKPLFEAYADRPLELQKHLIEYRFSQIVSITEGAIFTIDRILGYMARLLLVERWEELDVQEGIKVIDAVIEGVQ